MQQIDEQYESGHPIDVIETIAAHREWAFQRGTQDNVNLCLRGALGEYQLAISWHAELGGLHLACIFDARVPKPKRTQVYELLALINEQLWLGHFDTWSHDGALIFRQTLLVSGGGLKETQCDRFIALALKECERFFPAFQYLIWGGQTPQEALAGSMFETHGEA